MSTPRLWIATALAFVGLAASTRAASTLDIYFIDVEGGQSTLIATPAGQSFLVDTGYAGNNGRDAARILAAARDAGVTRIDYLLITHFHGDHDGGVVELAKQIPIGTFVDHGGLPQPGGDASDARWAATVDAFKAYAAVRGTSPHLEPKPGDRLPLRGLDVTFVSAAAKTVTTPLPGPGAGQSTPGCPASARPPGEPLENPRSTGFRLVFGQFRFIDVGDLSGQPLFALFCPANLVGRADVYLVPHHGGNDVSAAAYFTAVQPRVAILNNGAIKGGEAETFAALHSTTGIEDVWQLHRSRNEGSRNFADARIANLDETTGHWLKLSAAEDGSFSITNGRTGERKMYPRR